MREKSRAARDFLIMVNNLVRSAKGIFRRHIGLSVSIILIFVLFTLAATAPYVCPQNPFNQHMADRKKGPSIRHLMGTDLYGRDIFSRVIRGARPTLAIATGSIVLAFIVGVPLGLVSGYYRGPTDTVVMWLSDVLLSFPSYVMAVLVTAAIGSGLYKAIIGIGFVYVGRFTRLSRGSTLSVSQKDFVTASRACGAGAVRILFTHILRNIVSELIVSTTVWLGSAMLISAGLSFLGLGAQPPIPSWGNMLRQGAEYIYMTPWLAIFPGVAITLSALIFNYAGDIFQDYLNPKVSRPQQGRV